MRILRASGAGIWANCPGSTVLTGVPRPDTQESREGDLLHLLVFALLRGDVSPSDTPEQIDAALALTNATGLLVTEEYLSWAIDAAEYCESLGVQEPLLETFVSGGVLPEGVEGTFDFGGYNPETNTLHIVDYKFGFSPVEAVGNFQLLIYSLGITGAGIITAPAYNVALHIYQPRDFTSREPFKVWSLRRVDWISESVELKCRAKAAQDGEYTQTGAYCRYCESRLFCKSFLEVAAGVLESVTLDPQDISLAPEALGAGFDYLVRAEAIIVAARKAFEDHITAEIESGRPVSGWQIGSTGGRRKWSASIETIKSVAMMNGVTLTEEKPISLTAAWRNKEARPMLETLVTQGEGSKKLIPFDGKATNEVFNGQ